MASNATAAVIEQFQKANDHLMRGELQPAATLCQQILQQHESFAPAYSLMGEVWRQIGNIENSVKFLSLAIKFDPENPNFRVQHGQAKLLRGEWDAALEELKQAQKLDATNAIAYLLAGDIYVQKGEYEAALKEFAQAQKHSDMAEIEEHMGLCYQAMGGMEAAEKAYRNVIAKKPEYFHAYVQLGFLLLDTARPDEAADMFDMALEKEPNSFEAMMMKGRFIYGDGNREEAAMWLAKAIEVAPFQYRPYFYLGQIHQNEKTFLQAIPLFKRVVELKPDFLPAQQALAIALVNGGQKEDALQHLQAVLEKDPTNEPFKHIVAALTGENPENAPEEYVRSLFDGYAEQFEEHLTKKLGYQTPTVLADCFAKAMQQVGDDRTDMSLADLGCGTGLGAEALLDVTGYRAGVDLAGKMVEKAAAKPGLYDHLDVDDVVRFLEKSDRDYDLITAVDVLVYIGNLHPLFAAAKAKTAANGYFAISVENGDDAPPYVLRPSSRYAHAAEYVESLSQEYGFEMLAKEETVLRQEEGEPMNGYIYIFRLAA